MVFKLSANTGFMQGEDSQAAFSSTESSRKSAYDKVQEVYGKFAISNPARVRNASAVFAAKESLEILMHRIRQSLMSGNDIPEYRISLDEIAGRAAMPAEEVKKILANPEVRLYFFRKRHYFRLVDSAYDIVCFDKRVLERMGRDGKLSQIIGRKKTRTVYLMKIATVLTAVERGHRTKASLQQACGFTKNIVYSVLSDSFVRQYLQERGIVIPRKRSEFEPGKEPGKLISMEAQAKLEDIARSGTSLLTAKREFDEMGISVTR
jgi:hypothetical protein